MLRMKEHYHDVIDKRTTFVKAINLMDESVRQAVYDSLNRYGADGILIYENKDLSSSYVGERFAIGYGRQNTLNELPSDLVCKVSPPSGCAWQYYLVAWSQVDLSNTMVERGVAQ